MSDLHTSQNQAPYDGRSVANFILDLADARSATLTQMQLLKILYFCNGWYLAAEGHRLIKQDFQAWEYGPVIKVVRDAFRSFGKEPITSRATKLDIFSGNNVPVPKITNNYDVEFIRSVFEVYHVHDGWKLSDMTHEKGSPWDKIWNPSQPIGKLSLRIDEQSIKEHFSKLANRFAIN